MIAGSSSTYDRLLYFSAADNTSFQEHFLSNLACRLSLYPKELLGWKGNNIDSCHSNVCTVFCQLRSPLVREADSNGFISRL
jgi:hypothetical protein